ncbi:hypothetical protein ACEPAH_6267 [Sanghuangporus vaninii]
MTRTPAPGAPQSVSVFLRSYSPDTFEWENPAYDPRTSFVWSKPLVSFPSGSWSARSHCQDAAHCEGRSSPGSESLSDMSISLSDAGSGLSFSVLPPMIRTRAASVSSGRPLVLSSGSSSLSDMSISPTPSVPSQSPDKCERFVAIQSTRDPPANSTFLEDRHPHFPDTESVECSVDKNNDGDLDPVAVSKILEWTISLFTSVASSSLDYTIQPDVDDDSGSICPATPSSESEEQFLSPCSKDSVSDSCLLSSKIVVRINSFHSKGPPRSIQANPDSILMPGAVDYEAFNPEQPTTAKPVCMWGRRLERIPKVRLAGQQEAVYCFDSRKQRQKQKGLGISAVQQQQQQQQPAARQAMSTFNGYKDQQQKPTQVFYRARPLGAPLIRRDLPVTPVDAVKITQGQVLLQNVAPIRFNTSSAPSNRGALQEPSRRLPFASRSNWTDNCCHRMECAASPLFVKKIPSRGFL